MKRHIDARLFFASPPLFLVPFFIVNWRARVDHTHRAQFLLVGVSALIAPEKGSEFTKDKPLKVGVWVRGEEKGRERERHTHTHSLTRSVSHFHRVEAVTHPSVQSAGKIKAHGYYTHTEVEMAERVACAMMFVTLSSPLSFFSLPLCADSFEIRFRANGKWIEGWIRENERNSERTKERINEIDFQFDSVAAKGHETTVGEGGPGNRISAETAVAVETKAFHKLY